MHGCGSRCQQHDLPTCSFNDKIPSDLIHLFIAKGAIHMKAIGIIAEYNPFHNGHAYQIQKAKELSRADYVIVVMSGNYVQRGTPAISDKFSRASMALSGGADFVFELPVIWSTASAEYFAAAAIALLNALGCVDAVSFGCETPDLSLLTCIAEIFAREPEPYRNLLSSYLKQGKSFPAAREKALSAYLTGHENFHPKEELSSLLQSPNNILALEYMKALIRQNSRLTPLPVLRLGNGYHDTQFSENYCSAAAIRKLLSDALKASSSKSGLIKKLSPYMPQNAVRFLFSPEHPFLTEQDFSQMLFYRLLCEKETGFAGYADGSAELSNRILHAMSDFTDYRTFCERLKRKEVTYTRISRLLLHILLNITYSDYENGKDCNYIPYLRLLGFHRDAAGFFSEIKKHTLLPLIAKPSKCASILTDNALSMFQKDVFASDLYYGVQAQKSGSPCKNEYERQIVIV